MISAMKSEALVNVNPYLKDKTLYEKLLFINVSSAATIELGKLPSSLIKALQEKQPNFIFLSPEIEKEFSQ